MRAEDSLLSSSEPKDGESRREALVLNFMKEFQKNILKYIKILFFSILHFWVYDVFPRLLPLVKVSVVSVDLQ